MRRALPIFMLLTAAMPLPSAASADSPLRIAQADGTFPGTLACDGSGGSIRAPVTVEITSGRASYSFKLGGTTETGGGQQNGRTLVLTGRAKGYEARYSGEVSGTGGLLIGTQKGPGVQRNCQLSIGRGRS